MYRRSAIDDLAKEKDLLTLIEWVASGELHYANLSYACEVLGAESDGSADSFRAVAALLTMLEHVAPIVREGAVYGLGYHLTPDVRRALERRGKIDESPSIREAIAETLE